MNFSPAVISTGLRTCASGGVEGACAWVAEAKSDGLVKLGVFESPRYGGKLVGQAKDFNRGKNPVRCGKILMAALDEALSKINAEKLRSDRVGVFFGTSIGGIFETENAIVSNFNGCGDISALSYYECSTLAEFVAKRTGASGACMTFSTACSSSSLAIAAACDAIEQGRLDAVLVCGADALSRITVNGFGSLLLLSKGKSKPFDACRDGINLGEAAGVMVLCAKSMSSEYGAKPLAEIVGWGSSADAYHPTAPHPSGEGAASAMRKGLQKAELETDRISLYLSHGTGTAGNDSAEASALRKVFGSKIPPFTSIKGVFGHSLGASGILNAIISVETLRKSIIPKCAGFEAVDPAIGLSPARETVSKEIDCVLTSSLGFGGNNSCAVISKSSSCCRKKVENKRLYVYGCGVLVPGAKFCPQVFSHGYSGDFDIRTQPQKIEISSILKDVSPLKKRKWARLQQIGLQCAANALEGLNMNCGMEKTAVCVGTGLGMVSETARFVESTIAHNEAEPLPTAFTNSVHNAVSSLISLKFGFKALNSAVTAKEISFECALWQAWGEINSGAASAAVIGSFDEYSAYAQKFMESKHPEYVREHPLRDFGAAYFAGGEASCTNGPLAEILGIDFGRRKKDVSAEIALLENLLEKCGVQKGEIGAVFVPCVLNDKISACLSAISEALGAAEIVRLDDFCGASYSASALAIYAAKYRFGRGCHLLYSPASTGMRGATVFKIL